MKIQMVGKTQARLFHMGEFPAEWPPRMPGKAAGSAFEFRHKDKNPDGTFKLFGSQDKPYTGEALIEFAGRLCYESFDMPNEKTATREGYLDNIIGQGHESVLEHVSVTFYVEGVSRNLSHELIRHRHLSFSELSQRFVDMEDADLIVAPAIKEQSLGATWATKISEYPYLEDYKQVYDRLRSLGKSRKQAREAARFQLPSSMETKFVVTGNLRAWRDVLKKRDSEHADAEMQLFAKEVKRQLLEEYPDVFKDLDEDRNDGETA